MEQYSNCCQNVAPDESGARFAWHTSQKLPPEKWSQFMVPVSAIAASWASVGQYEYTTTTTGIQLITNLQVTLQQGVSSSAGYVGITGTRMIVLWISKGWRCSCTGAGKMLHAHSPDGNTFLHEIPVTSWPQSWKCDIKSIIQPHQLMCIYWKKLADKFHPDPISNVWVLGFFKDGCPNKNKDKMISDKRSVRNLKIYYSVSCINLYKL